MLCWLWLPDTECCCPSKYGSAAGSLTAVRLARLGTVPNVEPVYRNSDTWDQQCTLGKQPHFGQESCNLGNRNFVFEDLRNFFSIQETAKSGKAKPLVCCPSL